jgi:hypothetical protein
MYQFQNYFVCGGAKNKEPRFNLGCNTLDSWFLNLFLWVLGLD